MPKLKTILQFSPVIGCFVVSLFFLWYYFFRFYPRRGNFEDLMYAIIGFVAGIIWFQYLYKGYKLMKAEEKGAVTKVIQKIIPSQQSKAVDSPASRYWNRFMWVIVILFVLGLAIRYFLGVYNR